MSEVVDGEVVETTTAIAAYERPPAPNLFGVSDAVEVVARAASVADALKRVVKDRGLITNIQGKEYPQVEAWTLLGSMLGVFPVVEWTRKTDTGWEARVVATTRGGEVVGAAEAACNRDEKRWSKADDYAIRSMAQTRATSKALRQPLGFVMVLAGYSATPSEEMPNENVGSGTGGSVAGNSDTAQNPVAAEPPDPPSHKHRPDKQATPSQRGWVPCADPRCDQWVPLKEQA